MPSCFLKANTASSCRLGSNDALFQSTFLEVAFHARVEIIYSGVGCLNKGFLLGDKLTIYLWIFGSAAHLPATLAQPCCEWRP